MQKPELTPVIVAIGEYHERPATVADAKEPAALMAEALRAADKDGGGGWLPRLDLLTVIGILSWRYADVAGTLSGMLGISPAAQVNAGYGGETPIRLIHEAAARIAAGERLTAAIVGGEAMHSRNRARKEKAQLGWTPLVPEEKGATIAGRDYPMSAAARKLAVRDPAQIYPLYEMAAEAAWGQTPAEGRAESAALWARYAEVAAGNEHAWIRTAPDAETIATIGPDNRLINYPYPKLMNANPAVNQAGAVIVTSLAEARAMGVADERLVHVWGGAAASEADDYLLRDRYDRSTAQDAVLARAVEIAGGDASAFNHLELYSCFPVVPKMALRALGLDPARTVPTVAGGLTFFGGPLNNYMTHAVCAMVRAIRQSPDELGLLYGQGGFVNKHHALVVSGRTAPAPLAADWSVQQQAEQARDPVPPLVDDYNGPSTVESYTVRYGRNGAVIDGIVIARTADGARMMAYVSPDDAETLALLQADDRSAVGAAGHLRIDAFGKPRWEAGAGSRAYPALPARYCLVEREGPLTIITINRPEAMNALHPPVNAELAEIFDHFQHDPDQWVAILTGAGDRAFCSGNDLKYMSAVMARGGPLETPVKGYGGLTDRFDLTKPVIAAVNGVAMGGGFEVALACDIIIASETAKFALPEPKVGLAAVAGGLIRLPREVGLKTAMGMILTGRHVSAEEGERLGFVNEVAAPDQLLAVARRWAEQILACSPMSIRASKEVVHSALDTPTIAEASRMQLRSPAVRALFRSADSREGPLAFAQKRAPQWKGR